MRRRGSSGNNKEDRFRGGKGLGRGISKSSLGELYRRSKARFGFLDWWPGETKFEIIACALLTQQTSWANVEKAISNLKRARSLNLEAVSLMPRKRLESLIRPSGYFRQKAERLQLLCRFIKQDYGNVGAFLSLSKGNLKNALLAQNGIGNETCDSIMLYAADKPVFVVDAYTKRICARVFGLADGMGYGELQSILKENSGNSIRLLKDMHAQFVEIGKNYCKNKPLCSSCPLNKICRYSIKEFSNQ